MTLSTHRHLHLGILKQHIVGILITGALGCYNERPKTTQPVPMTPPASDQSNHSRDSRGNGAHSQDETRTLNSAEIQYGLLPITDENGTPSKLEDFFGRPLIVFFGYASCRTICPTSLGYLAQELELLGDDRKRIVALFISVDSKGDSPETVRRFVKQFAPDIKGFTASEENIRLLVTAFKPLGNYVPPTEPSTSHSFPHFRNFLLVDPKGQITGMFAPPHHRGALAKYIANHLDWYHAEQSVP